MDFSGVADYPYHGVDTQQLDLQFSNNHKAASEFRTHVKRLPRLDPATDPSISIVEAQEESYIPRMIQAIYSLDTVVDHSTFLNREGRLVTPGDPRCAPIQDVEATCRVLFHRVLTQCKSGYTGYNDRLNTPKGSQPEDTSMSCQQRVETVISALSISEATCRNVLYSDDAIINLANAPATMMFEKNLQIARHRDEEGKKKAREAAKMDMRLHRPLVLSESKQRVLESGRSGPYVVPAMPAQVQMHFAPPTFGVRVHATAKSALSSPPTPYSPYSPYTPTSLPTLEENGRTGPSADLPLQSRRLSVAPVAQMLPPVTFTPVHRSTAQFPVYHSQPSSPFLPSPPLPPPHYHKALSHILSHVQVPVHGGAMNDQQAQPDQANEQKSATEAWVQHLMEQQQRRSESLDCVENRGAS